MIIFAQATPAEQWTAIGLLAAIVLLFVREMVISLKLKLTHIEHKDEDINNRDSLIADLAGKTYAMAEKFDETVKNAGAQMAHSSKVLAERMRRLEEMSKNAEADRVIFQQHVATEHRLMMESQEKAIANQERVADLLKKICREFGVKTNGGG